MNISYREDILHASKVTMWTDVHERLPKNFNKKEIFLNLIFFQMFFACSALQSWPKKRRLTLFSVVNIVHLLEIELWSLH